MESGAAGRIHYGSGGRATSPGDRALGVSPDREHPARGAQPHRGSRSLPAADERAGIVPGADRGKGFQGPFHGGEPAAPPSASRRHPTGHPPPTDLPGPFHGGQPAAPPSASPPPPTGHRPATDLARSCPTPSGARGGRSAVDGDPGSH